MLTVILSNTLELQWPPGHCNGKVQRGQQASIAQMCFEEFFHNSPCRTKNGAEYQFYRDLPTHQYNWYWMLEKLQAGQKRGVSSTNSSTWTWGCLLLKVNLVICSC